MFMRKMWSQIGGGQNVEIERVWYPPIMVNLDFGCTVQFDGLLYLRVKCKKR